ncbi:MAG: hypothetical protein IKU52_05160 [Clostridia bacterium]|nr:hypothetical protein [Clostridia bacterium]
MYLPKLIPYDVKERSVSEFKGINKRKYCGEKEFFDTLNMSSCEYPLLSTSPAAKILDSIKNPSGENVFLFNNKGKGILFQNKNSYTLNYKGIERGSLYFENPLTMANILNFNKKTLFVKGNNRYEFDIETGKVDQMGYTLNIQYPLVSSNQGRRTVKLSFVYEDFSEIGKFASSTETAAFPSDASVGDCFVKYLDFYRLVSKNSAQSTVGDWQLQTNLRLRIDIASDYRKFKEGDYIFLKGFKYWNWAIRELGMLERFVRIEKTDANGRYITEPIATSVEMFEILKQIDFPTNDIYGYSDPDIDNPGNELRILEGEISADMPQLDLIIGGANRVWGCSNTTGEIFASELGNSRNWKVYEGISSDSYAVSVGSSGDFTAAVSYLGTPVFFKEDQMIVINGSRPSSYSLSAYSYRGVSGDSPMGLCVVNDILYYKSYDGIYAYSGTRPVCVSQNLGDSIGGLSNVIMAGEGEYLFLFGKQNGEGVHYVYDTTRDIWHKYSRPETCGFIRYPDATLEYCIEEGNVTAYTLYKGIPGEYSVGEIKEENKKWYWESGDIYYNNTKQKYLGKLTLDTESSESCELYISYNGGEFKRIGRFPPHKRGNCNINVFAQRCDYFRIRMEGTGKFVLYSITNNMDEVSENG